MADGSNTDLFSLQANTDYEFSIEKGADEKLVVTQTNLTTNTVDGSVSTTYIHPTGTTSNVVWSALINSPVVVGDTPQFSHYDGSAAWHAMYFAPTGDNKITKVTFETSVTNINAIGTNISTIEAKVGSTYNFSIDSVTSSTHPFYITTSLTGGQDAIDNSIHSGSEITLAGNIITFKPTQARTLFYHSGSHESMGGVINVTAPPAAAGSGGSSSGGVVEWQCSNKH